jgi:hypothetical protein
MERADKAIVTGAMDLPLTYEACDETIMGTEDSDDIDSIEEGEGKPLTRLASFLWYEKVNDSAPDPLPLTHAMVFSREASLVA